MTKFLRNQQPQQMERRKLTCRSRASTLHSSLATTHSSHIPPRKPIIDCWRSLFPILTVNFLGIKWASHHVSYIFYLFLTSSTSFGCIVVAGTNIPKMRQNWDNPGRPASPRPAGLAPPLCVPRLRYRSDRTCVQASKPRIASWFDQTDRKA